MDDELGYGESNAAPPARGNGRRRERKGSLAFISDNLPGMPALPKMPQIPAMLMPTMPANFPSMPGMPSMNPFGQKQAQEESSAPSSSHSRSSSWSGSDSSDSSESSSSADESRSKSECASEVSSSKSSDCRSKTNRSNAETQQVTEVAPNVPERATNVMDDDDDTTSTADDESLSNSKPRIAAGHTKTVGRLRKVVVLLIIGIAALVSTYTHKILIKYESEENMFNETATRVYSQAQANIDFKLSAVDTLAVNIANSVSNTNSKWPQVTVTEYESKASELRKMTSTESITFLPIITETTRQDWQSYSNLEFLDWIDESLTFAGQKPLNSDTESTEITPYIFDESGSAENLGLFLPIWQISPPNRNSSFYNLNLLSQDGYSEQSRAVFVERKPVIGDIVDKADSPLVRNALRLDELRKDDIYSVFYNPIYDSRDDAKVVSGVLMTVHSWTSIFLRQSATLFIDDASDDNDSIDCVVHTTSMDKYTIKVSATSVKLVGRGDHHNPKYNEFIQVFELASDNVVGKYTISMYPTSDPSDSNTTNQPAMYTSIVAVLFLLILCSFCTFNFAVEKRHRVLLRKARHATLTVASTVSTTFNVNKVEPKLLDNDEDMEKAPPRAAISNPSPSVSSRSTMYSHHKDSKLLDDSRKDESSHDDDTLDEHTLHSTTTQSQNPMIKEPQKTQMKNILKEENNEREDDSQGIPGLTIPETKPIADFFPHCTVLFADIVGFNAWSSSREPTQVFTLLQSVYQEFDKAAKHNVVFKVETIGDSYVAVTGLPEPQDNHAIIMSSFALECRKIFKDVTHSLERELGPDTSDDLCLRIGIHSGPVTAGLLRGEKHRFQLFGDTVNIASRMESTGEENLIQLSSATAKLLSEGGKGNWLLKRENGMDTEGKGDSPTYWLERKDSKSGRRLSVDASYFAFSGKSPSTSKKNSLLWSASENIGSLDSTTPQSSDNEMIDSTSRLVDWNVDILLKLLRQVVAHRMSLRKLAMRRASMERSVNKSAENVYLSANASKGISVVDIVTDVIRLPGFDPEVVLEAVDPETVTIDKNVKRQLKQFVQVIAGTYLPNPFHNYEHAVHVQMSMMKLLSRVTSPEHIDFNGDSTTVASDAHDYTYGITSDPLTQFSVVFAGLCHDCAHTGVPNSQLVKEKANVAKIYGNKSVAEQNSVDLAWSLLMNSDYADLRECIYSNESEFRRFRQLIVNMIIATDLFDRQLNEGRRKRWETAFNHSRCSDPSEEHNRRATVVVEYLIQASDVAHTMQHWKIYKKWNERLFKEMWIAYDSGRTDINPSIGWYKGELWFFDNYVIPLAKKLKECKIFGVSSDECLTYATENRATWAAEGEKILSEWAATVSNEAIDSHPSTFD